MQVLYPTRSVEELGAWGGERVPIQIPYLHRIYKHPTLGAETVASVGDLKPNQKEPGEVLCLGSDFTLLTG